MMIINQMRFDIIITPRHFQIASKDFNWKEANMFMNEGLFAFSIYFVFMLFHVILGTYITRVYIFDNSIVESEACSRSVNRSHWGFVRLKGENTEGFYSPPKRVLSWEYGEYPYYCHRISVER